MLHPPAARLHPRPRPRAHPSKPESVSVPARRASQLPSKSFRVRVGLRTRVSARRAFVGSSSAAAADPTKISGIVRCALTLHQNLLTTAHPPSPLLHTHTRHNVSRAWQPSLVDHCCDGVRAAARLRGKDSKACISSPRLAPADAGPRSEACRNGARAAARTHCAPAAEGAELASARTPCLCKGTLRLAPLRSHCPPALNGSPSKPLLSNPSPQRLPQMTPLRPQPPPPLGPRCP